MTPEQFWDGDPYLAPAFRKAEEDRLEAENYGRWMKGLYIFDAVSISLKNAFLKKGERAVPYLDKPYRITPKTEDDLKAEAEAERQKAIKSLNAWKAAWDRKNAGQ